MTHNIRTTLHRKSRRGSGGISIFSRYDVKAKVVSKVCDHFIVLSICVNTNKATDNNRLYVIACYIPPKSTNFQCIYCSGDYFGELSELIYSFSKLGSIIIMGNMNARTSNLIDFPSHSSSICIHYLPCDCNAPSWVPPKCYSKDKVVNAYGRELLTLRKNCNLFIVNGR